MSFLEAPQRRYVVCLVLCLGSWGVLICPWYKVSLQWYFSASVWLLSCYCYKGQLPRCTWWKHGLGWAFFLGLEHNISPSPGSAHFYQRVCVVILKCLSVSPSLTVSMMWSHIGVWCPLPACCSISTIVCNGIIWLRDRGGDSLTSLIAVYWH